MSRGIEMERGKEEGRERARGVRNVITSEGNTAYVQQSLSASMFIPTLRLILPTGCYTHSVLN